MLVQDPGEHRRQRAVWYGLATFTFGLAVLVGYSGYPRSLSSFGSLIPLAIVVLMGVFAMSMAARQRPFALFETGLLLPSKRFLPYNEVRDIQRVQPPVSKSSVLVLAKTDGTVGLIGHPWAKNVWFGTAQFDAVEALIRDGVQRMGPEPKAEWDPALWSRIESLEYRGPVIANAEAFAQEHHIARIDSAVLHKAATNNQRLEYWLETAGYPASQAARHPKRKPTP